MYNLYRAWFGDESYPHLETLSPPDTVIRVGNEGEHQFVAHRGVLAAHSGYLKALLATNTPTTSNITSLSVSSVGGEAFAPLLNYMYTGRLDVTLDNIYSVLLATHLLHMPGALEQCRAALLRLRGPPPPPCETPLRSSATNILRPVPNRLMCWPQDGLYTAPAPVTFSHLSSQLHHHHHHQHHQLQTNLPVLPTLPTTLAHDTTIYKKSPTISPPPAQPQLTQHVLKKTTKNSDSTPEIPKAHCSRKKEEVKPSKSSPMDGPSKLSNNDSLITSEKIMRTNLENKQQSSTSSEAHGVVLDIACCDGPVKFQRVLNQNYSGSSQQPQRSKASYSSGEIDLVNFEENDENGRPDDTLELVDETVGSASESSGSYKCNFCPHTFKSQYCYKKHARRHLLPAEAESNSQTDGARRREVRLLDLNVQYYPCKICGSKFPSYYFVHKHKKLCHSGIEERASEGEASGSNTA